MLSCCLKCRKNKESKKPKVEKIKNGRIMISSNRKVCDSTKLRFIKEQEASGFLIGLSGVKSTFEGIPILKNII